MLMVSVCGSYSWYVSMVNCSVDSMSCSVPSTSGSGTTSSVDAIDCKNIFIGLSLYMYVYASRKTRTNLSACNGIATVRIRSHRGGGE